MSIKNTYQVKEVLKERAKPWLEKKHYAQRVPAITHCFGLFDYEDNLHGICTFGPPPRMFNDGYGLFGGNLEVDVYELNRLVTEDSLPKNATSYFVSHSLEKLPDPCAVISYADANQNHHGYVYQATNFKYIGTTSDRNRYWDTKNEKWVHERTLVSRYGSSGKDFIQENLPHIEIKDQVGKYRYVYFVGNKRWKRKMNKYLDYEVKDYPKGDNEKYDASADINDKEKDWERVKKIKEWCQIDGVGQKTAEILFDEIGTLDDIDEWDSFLEIKGIGKTTLKKIKRSYIKQKYHLKTIISNVMDSSIVESYGEIVKGEGNKDAKVYFVSGFPNEIYLFGSKEREKFDELLEKCCITLDDVYITSLLKVDPGNKDIGKEDIKAHKEWLLLQLDYGKPSIVVTLGDLANKFFASGGNVDKMNDHGNVKFVNASKSVSKLGNNKFNYMPCIHPKFVVNNSNGMSKRWNESIETLKKWIK